MDLSYKWKYGEGGTFLLLSWVRNRVARWCLRNTGSGRCHFGSAIGCVGQVTGRILPQDTSVRVAENVFGEIRCRLHGLTGLLQFTRL